MDDQRKAWNQKQKKLRPLLDQPDRLQEAQAFFLDQHAALHKATMIPDGGWSFADTILKDMTEAGLRRIPKNRDHSVAWCFRHMARIEDVTMNLLVDGRPQILHRDSWLQRMNVTTQDTGNDMNPAEIAHLSATINLDALQDYRLAVCRRTQEIASQLPSEALKQPVNPARLQMIVDQGAVPAGSGLLDYWGNRTIAGLLLMPPTRHNFIHLNEALRLKHKRS